jgi:hypothetical protein
MHKGQNRQTAANFYRLFLLLVSLVIGETTFFLLQYLAVKSESGSSLLWGYSGARLAILATLMFALLACIALIVFLLRAKKRTQKLVARYLHRERLQKGLIWGFLFVFGFLLILTSFNPASFARYQPHFEQLRPLLVWMTLVSGQILAFLLYAARQSFLDLTRKQIIFLTLSLLLVFVWFLLRAEMVGRPSTSWMTYYQPDDFSDASPGEIWAFFREMRSGIPPLLSFLEILNVKITGSTAIITDELYRLALLVAYLLAMWLFSKKIFHGIASFLLALVFIPATVFISAQNPEIYDVYFPTFFLLFLFFDRLVRKADAGETFHTFAAFLSGLFLAFAELSRPFVLIFIPIILLFLYLAYRPLPKKRLVAFLIPFLLLSGGWHAKLLAFNNRQVFWSNHSGFNFYRAWGDVIPMPELVDEPQTWDDRVQIHTQEHYENSKRIQSAVVNYIITHPRESLPRIVERLGTFLRPRISLFDQPEPEGFYAWTYRLTFYAAFSFFLIQLIRLLVGLTTKPSWSLIGDPEHILLVVIAGSILILALAESGEEARLLLEVLPLLTALPRFEPA